VLSGRIKSGLLKFFRRHVGDSFNIVLVLLLEAIHSAQKFRVLLVSIVVEAQRIVSCVCVTKEVNHFLELFFDVIVLIIRVMVSLLVKFLLRVFKSISLGRALSLRNHSLYIPEGVGVSHILNIEQKSRKIDKFLLGILNKIFKSNPQNWNVLVLLFLSFSHHDLEPVFIILSTLTDTPVPPSWVTFSKLIRNFCTVRSSVVEVSM